MQDVLIMRSFICDSVFCRKVLSDEVPQFLHPFPKWVFPYGKALSYFDCEWCISWFLWPEMLSLSSLSQKELECYALLNQETLRESQKSNILGIPSPRNCVGVNMSSLVVPNGPWLMNLVIAVSIFSRILPGGFS